MPDALVDFATAADGFGRVLAGCTDLSAPSPCPDWVGQDVVDHVFGGMTLFTERFGGVPADVADDASLTDRYAALRAALVAAISAPGATERMVDSPIGGQLPAGVMFGIYTTDVLLHTWDLAVATGQDAGLDPELLERSWQNALPLDELIRGPGVFGPKVDVGDDAPRDVQALAFFGRDARS